MKRHILALCALLTISAGHAAENVGCMHWGLVNGGTHTHYALAEINLFKETIAASRT